jgi:2-iminobutanoate/2-iminopropanoate deaminase
MRMSVVLLCLLFAACAAPPPAPAPAAPPDPEFINLDDSSPYPFSSAVRAGDLIFLSGQVGEVTVDGTPQLVPGGFDAQARQAMENIKNVVEHAGSSMDRVVKCQVMLADMANWPRFNEIYAEFFPGPKPARDAWGANGLALGAAVEVDCIAMAR